MDHNESVSNYFEGYARRFARADLATRIKLGSEIRDNMEIIHIPNEYKNFLKYLFPVFYNILRDGTKAENVDPIQNKLRNIILEILNRLQFNDLLKQVVPNLLKLTYYLLEIENEENALICLRIIMEIHKSYR
eukprot:TRINITY_DN3346_c0_g1_i1.p1 TRINITY_DN3346_c0_g1~~TRINITY_DN3346_c0_g1_i1.p1  ORF type:complete len:133 (+),score=23.52 TRINITY_DN3346_c0_g1_i1:58-456(+)